jgi:hypothetical protein
MGDRAQQILAAYGGAPQRWPLDERGVVLDALVSAPAAVAQHRAQSALDALLEEATPHVPSPTLLARIRAGAVPAMRQGISAGWRATLAILFSPPSMGFLRPSSALVVAIALGVVAGAIWAPHDDANAMATDFFSLAFGHDFQSEPNLGSGLQ